MRDYAQLGLDAQMRRVDGAATITLTGDIDCSSLDVARQALSDAGNYRGTIVFDLSEVTFCDCAGIHFLIEARNRVKAAGGMMTVHNPSRMVRRVFELTGTLGCLCPDEPAPL